MKPFLFIADVLTFENDQTRILNVPSDAGDKASLLAWYVSALDLPKHFGLNWDALDECLRDLSWLTEHKLILYHKELPLKTSTVDQTIYLELLANAVCDWKPDEDHELVAAFDPTCELRIHSLLKRGGCKPAC